MRELNIGTKRHTVVVAEDEPSLADGACHKYRVLPALRKGPRDLAFARVSFQDGPVKENDLNGCFHEDLIAIVIDRLEHYQKGEFACRENAIAITKLEEAMHRLADRTKDRQKRGVEGTSAK